MIYFIRNEFGKYLCLICILSTPTLNLKLREEALLKLDLDKIIVGGNLSLEVKTSQLVDCILHCVSDGNCKSGYFDDGDPRCRLYTQVGTVASQQGSVVFSDWGLKDLQKTGKDI